MKTGSNNNLPTRSSTSTTININSPNDHDFTTTTNSEYGDDDVFYSEHSKARQMSMTSAKMRLDILNMNIEHLPHLENTMPSPVLEQLENPLLELINLRNGQQRHLSDLKRVHLCSEEDDEPFSGILTTGAAKLSCCPLVSFTILVPNHPEYRTAFTQFGRRLLHACHLQGHDLQFDLSDKLFSNYGNDPRATTLGKIADLREFLRQNVPCLIDDDGVTWKFDECSICLASCRFVRKPSCCQKTICQICWSQYVRTGANDLNAADVYELRCFSCHKIVPYNEALTSLEDNEITLIRPICKSPDTARCPTCLQPILLNFDDKDEAKMKKLKKKKGGYPVNCERCHYVFCGLCSSNVHPEISCRKILNSDHSFRKWMKQRNEHSPEFRNGRRCPSCSCPVTREGGCPTVTCKCGTNFCFSCGQTKLRWPLALSHTSNRNLPFVSCPKLWRSKTKRLLVHSFVGLGLMIGVFPFAVALSPVVVPVGLIALLANKHKQK